MPMRRRMQRETMLGHLGMFIDYSFQL